MEKERAQAMWLPAAFLSAIFGAMATLVIKQFVTETDSTLATALRTCVVLAVSWLMTWRAGSAGTMGSLPLWSVVFIILSGISTALSWLCYYRALTGGEADKVMAIEKASILMTLILAITIFGERSHLPVKLVGMGIMAGGLYLLASQNRAGAPAQKGESRGEKKDPWLAFAFMAAVFSSLNTVFSKLGVSVMDSNLATAVNTTVMMPVVWAVACWKMRPAAGQNAFADPGRNRKLTEVSRREFGWITVSGLATGACWLCYYYAVKYGPVSVVLPVNKLSVPIAVIYSYVALGERMKRQEMAGVTGIVFGMLTVAVLS